VNGETHFQLCVKKPVGETGRGDAPPRVDSGIASSIKGEVPSDDVQVYRDLRVAARTLCKRIGFGPPVMPDFDDRPPGANNEDLSWSLQFAAAELWSRLGLSSPFACHCDQGLGNACVNGSTSFPEPTCFRDACWSLQLALIELCFREGLPSPFANDFDQDGDMYIQGVIHDTCFGVPGVVWGPPESDDADAPGD
jgi:hypothetical protein